MAMSCTGPADNAGQYARMRQMVAEIHSGSPHGMEELYGAVGESAYSYLCWRLGPDCARDRLHDTFVAVVEAIQSGVIKSGLLANALQIRRCGISTICWRVGCWVGWRVGGAVPGMCW